MLRGGRGGRLASQALALGGRRARGCSWSSGARSWSCLESPPSVPRIFPSARASGRPASTHPGSAGASPEPGAGQPPGRSLSSWDACGALALPGPEPRYEVGRTWAWGSREGAAEAKRGEGTAGAGVAAIRASRASSPPCCGKPGRGPRCGATSGAGDA